VAHPLTQTITWVALSMIKGLGPKGGLSLAERWAQEPSDQPPVCVDPLEWSTALKSAEGVLSRCVALEILALSYTDERYPPLLRLTPRPPLVLYLQGALPQQVPQLACVGTRAPTPWGRACASEVAKVAVEEGYGVTSGLALGVDGCGHEACLSAGGRTWAVLGSGHEQLSPRQHLRLAERILVGGGGVLSEYPPHTPLHPGQLVARDRLQSGLSLATLVVESGEGGGALHAARASLRQGRALWVPRSPAQLHAHPKHAGLAQLRAEGAQRLADPSALRVALTQLRDSHTLLHQEGLKRRTALWSPLRPRLL